jgi:UDP-N-acetylglucosamine 2-epimerase (non-hydrolysing)
MPRLGAGYDGRAAPPSDMKTILHVVGARPNFMKVAPVMAALARYTDIRQLLVNTGQHYDEAMAGIFLKEFGLPAPDRDLGVGSASHAVQTARVMTAFESVCLELRPDLVVVVGDVNSTMAATLVAVKLLIPVAHVEAGLRSNDRAMPEEINRIVTDRLADVLLTPSPDGDANLLAEGVSAEKIHHVGNVMIDTLMRFRPSATVDRIADRVPVARERYAVLTLHRPSNVDERATFTGIVAALAAIARDLPIVFPVHPRTEARIGEFGLQAALDGVSITPPFGYIDFLSLTSNAALILTDSGGLQEESTALGIPCLTLRENTERPITVTHGTNRVVGTRCEDIVAAFHDVRRTPPPPRRPELWDGHAGERIASVLHGFLCG